MHTKRCPICYSRRCLETDHIWPRSLGGSDDLDNLQTLCRECNRLKSGRRWSNEQISMLRVLKVHQRKRHWIRIVSKENTKRD